VATKADARRTLDQERSTRAASAKTPWRTRTPRRTNEEKQRINQYLKEARAQEAAMNRWASSGFKSTPGGN
jgi:hypothetical protein